MRFTIQPAEDGKKFMLVLGVVTQANLNTLELEPNTVYEVVNLMGVNMIRMVGPSSANTSDWMAMSKALRPRISRKAFITIGELEAMPSGVER